MKRYDNKYQRGSPRLQGFDYANDSIYFITINTKNRSHYFGKINKGKIILSTAGKIIENEWLNTEIIRKSLKITLDKYCIMPNHFHALLKIGDPILPTKDSRVPPTNDPVNKFGKQSQNISSIIRGFKGSCTKRIREDIKNFAWQRGFYDHIVRDLNSLDNIRNYIIENPSNWKDYERTNGIYHDSSDAI